MPIRMLIAMLVAAAALPAQTAATPPMGWNSYDYYNWTVNEAEMMANAQWVAEHLKPYGWQYVVVDFLWSTPLAQGTFSHRQYQDGKARFRLSMDADGRLLPDPARFPSAANGAGFKPLADRVHKLGLKFGIHVMRGIPRQAVADKSPIPGTKFTADQAADQSSICKWQDNMYGLDMSKPAAQAYLDSIFKLYASWGVDFVKVDDILNPYHKEEIAGYHKAIVNSKRPMVLSLSLGPVPVTEAGFLNANANMWRITDDAWDNWRSLRNAFRQAENWQGRSRAGVWPDLDMLPLGRIAARYNKDNRSFTGEARDCRLTRDEQRTWMSLWAIYRSPLIMGGNLPDNDEWTTSLLANREVIELNQHSRNNRMVRGGTLPVYTADAAKGMDKYVALFNTTDALATVSVNLADLGAGPSTPVELWEGKKLAPAGKTIEVTLAPHASALYRLEIR